MTTQLQLPIPKERLAKIASWRELYGAGHNVMLPAEEAEALARFALAAYEQEPVFFVEIEGDDWINAGRIEGKNRPDLGLLPDGINNLYAHPAPVVEPEEEPVVNSEAVETLQKICNIFRIGIQAQTQYTILANVENAVRFADQLHAIEREFFMVPGEPDEDCPDDEPADVCLVNCWGSTTERYVEQFRAALMRVAHLASSTPAAERIAKLESDCWTYEYTIRGLLERAGNTENRCSEAARILESGERLALSRAIELLKSVDVPSIPAALEARTLTAKLPPTRMTRAESKRRNMTWRELGSYNEGADVAVEKISKTLAAAGINLVLGGDAQTRKGDVS